jgi:hypothetical protein
MLITFTQALLWLLALALLIALQHQDKHSSPRTNSASAKAINAEVAPKRGCDEKVEPQLQPSRQARVTNL